MGPLQFASTEDIKALRVQADGVIQAIEDLETSEDAAPDANHRLYDQAQMEAFRAATEAKMWLGKMLEGKGNPFPKELADKAE